MTVEEALQGVSRLFLDTPPVIYYVERHPRYGPLVDPIFDRIDEGRLEAVTSPVTLAECLVVPYRDKRPDLQSKFADLIVNGTGVTFAELGADIARQAADLRARYKLALADAFQIATARASGCDAFLTNDVDLLRVTELQVLVLENLTL
jgi:predicted nucleic acid-binding protein